jgi:thymidylate synthase (FAD)
MGTDLTVVNAARVSFDKESDWDYQHNWAEPDEKFLKEKDKGLIKYLATHNHWTPFSHVQITMRETVPIFVARQRFKHVVGFTYNEVSRRYVDDTPAFFVPSMWRRASENKKQGSSDEAHQDTEYFSKEYKEFISDAQSLYETLIKDGVAPEQARMVLPQSMYTSYYTTGSLYAWARAYTLRSEEHAQKEIRDLASQWNTVIGSIKELEHSWSALTLTP